MNINDLTIGQAKELASIFTNSNASKSSSLYDGFIGKYCIVRSRNEGINAGKVVIADETGVVIEDARRLYYHKPANEKMSWYEGVAVAGISSDSKVGEPVKKLIIEDYSLTKCSEEAEKSIREAKTNEQS
uniref:DUF6948 domain-containing protein n=1 Tax=Ningiella ruwaisensis TaxID=2364274 RepID=UPI0010A05F2C|nr:hypothetical protein [Ningiella ruwaisensis]